MTYLISNFYLFYKIINKIFFNRFLTKNFQCYLICIVSYSSMHSTKSSFTYLFNITKFTILKILNILIFYFIFDPILKFKCISSSILRKMDLIIIIKDWKLQFTSTNSGLLSFFSSLLLSVFSSSLSTAFSSLSSSVFSSLLLSSVFSSLLKYRNKFENSTFPKN